MIGKMAIAYAHFVSPLLLPSFTSPPTPASTSSIHSAAAFPPLVPVAAAALAGAAAAPVPVVAVPLAAVGAALFAGPPLPMP